MKTIFVMLSLCASFLSVAQIPNPGFEDTTITGPFNDTIPRYWSTEGAGTSAHAFTGHYAASVWNWYSYARGWMALGQVDVVMYNEATTYQGGIPFTVKPTALTGYFYYDTTHSGHTNDSAAVIITAKKWNATLQKPDTVALGLMKFGPATSYTAFRVPIDDLRPGVAPDSVAIAFFSCFGGYCVCTGVSNCLYLYVDDLALETGATNTTLLDRPRIAAFPNPAFTSVTVRAPAHNGDVNSIVMYDLLGRQLRRYDHIRDNALTIERDDLPAGIYYLYVNHSSGAEPIRISFE